MNPAKLHHLTCSYSHSQLCSQPLDEADTRTLDQRKTLFNMSVNVLPLPGYIMYTQLDRSCPVYNISLWGHTFSFDKGRVCEETET